ncbi:MFS transporter [Nocardia sp. NPDC004722]
MSHSTIFSNRNFLLLWSGNAASHIGLHGVRLAYPLLAMVLTDSPMWTSVVSFAIALPGLIFEVPAGVVSDYWDRRRILVLCQQLGLLATLLAAMAIILRPPGLPLFLAVAAFVEGAAYVFFNTSELGLVGEVVSANERPVAYSFLEAEQPIANMVGRMLGAATLGLARSLPFLANAFSYLFCLWTLSRMRGAAPVEPDRPKPARVWDWNQAWAGVRSIWGEPFVRGATSIIGITNIVFSILILLITVEIKAGGHSAWLIGLVLGATGLGGILGAVPAAGLAQRYSPRVLLTATLWAWTILFIPIVIDSHPIVIALCWMGAGFAAPIGNIAVTLYRVRAFPEEVVGRVFGASRLITHGGTAIGALISGTLLSVLGTSMTGWALIIGMIVLARRARRLPEPSPRAAQPATNWITQASRTNPDKIG